MVFGTAIPRFESWRPSQLPLGKSALSGSDFSDRKEQTPDDDGTRVGTVSNGCFGSFSCLVGRAGA